jgi:hypothetical protein
MKIYPLIIGVGVLYINGKEAYDVLLLEFIKQIQDRIGLLILL